MKFSWLWCHEFKLPRFLNGFVLILERGTRNSELVFLNTGFYKVFLISIAYSKKESEKAQNDEKHKKKANKGCTNKSSIREFHLRDSWSLINIWNLEDWNKNFLQYLLQCNRSIECVLHLRSNWSYASICSWKIGLICGLIEFWNRCWITVNI